MSSIAEWLKQNRRRLLSEKLLTPLEFKVFKLREVDKLTFREIGDRTDHRQDQMRTIYYRARRKLALGNFNMGS